jgi:hypothetical protein
MQYSFRYLVGVGENGLEDGDDVGVPGEGGGGDAEEALELLQADGDGGAGHEAHDRGVRQVLDDEAQPKILIGSDIFEYRYSVRE